MEGARRAPMGIGGPGKREQVQGTSFAVWTPNARAVQVIGDFNGWDGAVFHADSGTRVWEAFIPEEGRSVVHQHLLRRRLLERESRSSREPMSAPATASITESTFAWNDAQWLADRAETNPHTGPMSVYEVQLGSWRQGLNHRITRVRVRDVDGLHPRRVPPRC